MAKIAANSVQLGGSPLVELDAVREVWVRGRATRRGALIGAVGLGLAAGAGLGYDCATEGAEVDCRVVAVTVVGGLLGAAVGSGLGAAVGALVPRWHRRYP